MDVFDEKTVIILVFALWYWEIDGGGPLKGHLAGHQVQAAGHRERFSPSFSSVTARNTLATCGGELSPECGGTSAPVVGRGSGGITGVSGGSPTF